jgi:putative membrane protein
MLYILSLHIIFIVTWFAGLFYIVRLFIYHVEANEKPEPERSILIKQFQIMERRLWYGITWPSAIATFIFGPWLYFVYFPEYIFQAFFILKLCFVFALALYHLQCHNIFKQLQKNEVHHSSFFLRVWNEVASILLVAIVFIIVLKQNNEYVWFSLGIIIFMAALYIGIQLYKKNREKKPEEKNNEPTARTK